MTSCNYINGPFTVCLPKEICISIENKSHLDYFSVNYLYTALRKCKSHMTFFSSVLFINKFTIIRKYVNIPQKIPVK